MITPTVSLSLQLAAMLLPWSIRRRLLNRLLGFSISPGSKVGLSLLLVGQVELCSGARIGHMNMVKGLSSLRMDAYASIGRGNWITGYPAGRHPHFAHLPQRDPSLMMEEHSALTNRHIVDCTDRVRIGRFTTFGGFRSQLLTHSIDIHTNRQQAKPVEIGSYCFIGTGVIMLPGSVLPDYCVLAAGSVLHKAQSEPNKLYAGNPANPVRNLDISSAYFSRKIGYVV